MKYMIKPILRFLWFLLGGAGWLLTHIILFLWDFKIHTFRFEEPGYYYPGYKTPLDYILGRKIYKYDN